MFICEITGRLSKLGEKLHKVVVATRERTYTRWIKDEETNKWIEVESGRGWEIVKELNATQTGVELWNSWNAEERTLFLERN